MCEPKRDSCERRLNGTKCDVRGEKVAQEQMSGWLTKRTRFSRKWRKHWFSLDKSTLRYGNSEKELSKKIRLDGARILESTKDGKPFAFCLQPRSGKQLYHLQAEDEIGRNKWMQAICFAKMASSTDEKKASCTIL